jgi:hypothetical protein
MILPEIEEEEEEGQKLSLTSLLLGDSSVTVLYKVHVNSKYKKTVTSVSAPDLLFRNPKLKHDSKIMLLKNLPNNIYFEQEFSELIS